MANQQKQVQQETAYSAVVVNDHMYPRPCLYNIFHVSMTPYGSKMIYFFSLVEASLERQGALKTLHAH